MFRAAASRTAAASRRAISMSAVRMQPLYFTKTHEWVDIQGSEAAIGISHHAQEELGEIVYVQLPDVGRALKATESFAAVESVKATAEVYAPVAGTVTAVNDNLSNAPETLNKDPQGAGWMIKLKDVSGTLPEGLLSEAEYKKFLEAH